MGSRIIKHIIVITLLSSFVLFSQNGSTIPKQGGICFRVDDNGLIEQFRDYTNIFAKYNAKYNFALNLGFNEFDSQDYVDSIKVFQSLGHELMDHTPDHRTNYFNSKLLVTSADTNYYKTHPGVDHLEGNKVCLKHEAANISLSSRTDTATISNDTIYFSNSNYSAITKYEERYIYLPTLDSLLIVKKYKSKKAIVTDIWDNPVNFNNQIGVTYYTFIFKNINLTSDAIFLLADETQKLATLYGITPPKTWIQPGGNFLEFNSDEIKIPFESLGYIQGATYPDEAKKVYNEYNPTGERQFAMQWGNFVETDQDLATLKLIIADDIAKHKMLVGNTHWYSGDPVEWNNYIVKNDSLLSWATTNSIPIRTYSEWSDLLYFQTPDPYENIMPPFNVDKDANGIPDGYTNVLYPNNIIGTFVTDSTTPGPGANYYSATTDNAYDPITNILQLGGFEKGANDFSIWTKGSPGDSVEVIFAEAWPSNNKTSFKFPAVTTTWKKYSLSEQGKSFIVNDTTSVLDVDIYCSDYVSGTVKIAGMFLAKMPDITNLEMNILSTLPAIAGDTLLVEIIAKDEFGHPHNNYLSYSLDTTGSSTVQIISSLVRAFNGTAKDTITIVDTTAGSFNLSATLTNKALVSDNKNITILHADIKYLKLLTSTSSISVGSSRLIKVALEDTFLNRIPDSLLTFEALSGNGKFSSNLQTITIPTNSIGVAKDFYTASTLLSYVADTIRVSTISGISDTLILPLKSETINKFIFTNITPQPFYTDSIIYIEVAAIDTFNNPVVSSENFILSTVASTSSEFIPTNIFTFSNSAKDTIAFRDSTAELVNIVAKLQSDLSMSDTINIEITDSPKSTSIKIFLEGPYALNKMEDDLTLPLQQPFNVSPWNYSGTEAVTTIPNDIVDWLLVTLRKDVDPLIPNPSTAIDVITKAYFVNELGNILDLGGINPIHFNIPKGNYYLVIQHRNHLDIMSSATISLE